MRAPARALAVILGVALSAAAGYGVLRSTSRARRAASIVVPPPVPVALADAGVESDEDDRPYSFRVPTGEPATLGCDAARAIVSQARASLAYDPEPVAPKALATSTADWLDPHGLWSAAPDAPVEAALVLHAAELANQLESPSDADCSAARAVGAVLATWVAELAKTYDRERAVALTRAADLSSAADDSMFEGGTITRSARDLTRTLGQHVGALQRALGPQADPYASAARARFFPSLDAEDWSRVILAASVRAYVQLVDPHGAWAPFDEEASVYEVDLESNPPDKLWDKATRTAIGVRIESAPRAPLQTGDVVLSLVGVLTAGLPLEQIEQLGFAAAEAHGPATAVVLRAGEGSLRTLVIDSGESPPAPRAPIAPDDDLDAVRVPYGPGDALVITIPDVRDDLGDQITRALTTQRASDTRPLEGVVLDLRGNGGGSTEGAIAALGAFLPGVPLFPMKRRDGTIETDRAPEPPMSERWAGPVAALVDGETASAAEMIAGALVTYHRGPTIGTPTYGKGCAQEYVDDDAHTGVLRLTTLLYALPDGAPVQRVGLSPTILLPFAPPSPSAGSTDREALLSHAPPSWRGPDVRDRGAMTGGEMMAWPPHGGSVGPCKKQDVCRALRAVGGGVKRISASKPPR